jgi:regulator of sigma E protease
MSTVLSVFFLGLLVAVHEFGHLLAARAFGMTVERFAIGFGPPIFAFTRRGIEYSLRAIPFGGYVRIAGMTSEDDTAGENSFKAKPLWQRAIVLFAGSGVNYLGALVLLFLMYAGGANVPIPRTIGEVAPGSEAARVQLRPGDEITDVDGTPMKEWSDLVSAISKSDGRTVTLTILRDGRTMVVITQPRADGSGLPKLGVIQLRAYRSLTLGQAAGHAVRHAHALVGGTLIGLGQLVTGKVGAGLEGPVGIVRRTAFAWTEGVDAFLSFLGLISIAVAFFNLLPVPGLDGGRLLFLGIAAVRGKPVDERFENALTAAGFVLLLSLIAWVTLQDVRNPKPVGPPPVPQRAPAPADDAGAEPLLDLDAGALQ